MAVKADQHRFDCLQKIGCIACLSDGTPGVFGDIHHLVDKGNREASGGNAASLCLCPWHHRGVPAMGFGQKWMTEKYGPSLALSKRDFTGRYGTERKLLERTDTLIGSAVRGEPA